MIILTLIVCLLAERFFKPLQSKRNFGWFSGYQTFIHYIFKKLNYKQGKIAALLILFPAPFIVGYIDLKLYQLFLPLEFLFSSAILLYSFGPQPFFSHCKNFITSQEEKDQDAAMENASKILNRKLYSEEKNQLNKTITKSLFDISNTRIFGVVFWFVLLGPMGALLYRCVSLLQQESEQEKTNGQQPPEAFTLAVQLFHDIINWLPSRLTAFGYAAMGNFIGAINYCENYEKLLIQLQNQSNEQLLSCMGAGAINMPKEEKDCEVETVNLCIAIIRRNIMLWLGTISILTLAGWL